MGPAGDICSKMELFEKETKFPEKRLEILQSTMHSLIFREVDNLCACKNNFSGCFFGKNVFAVNSEKVIQEFCPQCRLDHTQTVVKFSQSKKILYLYKTCFVENSRLNPDFAK
jgi:hypothetical protein